jgi:hypothetical protein
MANQAWFAMILPRARSHIRSQLDLRMKPMSAGAVTSNVWRGFASVGLAAGGALVMAGITAGSAVAQSNPCAIYGAGFVPVAGTDTCVRIGGRVRVDGAVSPSQDTYGSSGVTNFAPAPTGLDGPDRAHLRLQGGASSGMPRTR